MHIKGKLLVISLFSCAGAMAQLTPVPANYSIVDTASGDLDKDGIPELAVAYNTRKETDHNDNVPRELIIYKKAKGQWTVWKKSSQALAGSRDGGMMGDPYGNMSIEKGILSIFHEGGSSWKWARTDKYRYQDAAFYLIGYVENYGKPCEYFQDIEFNLSTGKLIIKKEYEDCESDEQSVQKNENETFEKKGIKITLEKRNEKDVKIVSPKYKHEIYIAMKYD